MLTKDKKKHGGSNINININFKVETKNHIQGKKISTTKDIKKGNEAIRPNSQYRKKSQYTENTHNKQSIQEFTQDRTAKQYKQDQNNNAFANIDRHELGQKGNKLTTRKRLKSKSLENLKVRYYARTPEAVSRSNSKMTSKSRSKHQSRSQSIANSKSKSKKKMLSNQKSSPRSFLHSEKKKDKKRSKSKSPLMSKKRSLQGFKLRGQISSRELIKDKSKEKRWEKNINTVKKNQLSQPSFEKGPKSSVNNMKKTIQTLPQKPKARKSSDKIKQKVQPTMIKPLPVMSQRNKPKKTKKKGTKIYSQVFLEKMAIRIQSYWRGYRIRKQFREELTQIAAKISRIKDQHTMKPEFWQSSSNQSISPVPGEQQSIKTSKSSQLIRNISESERSNTSNQVHPMFAAELQKLRKKLEEQEDRFKVLAEQNNQLRANLSKINKQYSDEKNRKPSKQLIVNHNVVSMRIESQQSEPENGQLSENKTERSKRRRQKMLQLPSAIKTEQSRDEEFSQLKKKMESYQQCSPKNKDFNVKFQTFLKKILSQQQQSMNEKYFRKNSQMKNMLQNQLVSPKTYNQKCSQLEFKFMKEKEETINKYKEAEKALRKIAELQEEQNSSFTEQQNQKKYANSIDKNRSPVHHISPSHESPQKKTVNLIINVDEIESNNHKYHPMLVNNSHRSPEQQRHNQDLNQLYEKAMTDKVDTKRRDIYLQGEEYEVERSEEPSREQSTMIIAKTDIVQFPQFELSNKIAAPIIKGFETNLRYIRIFYIKFCQYFRQISAFRDEILHNISTPITFDSQLYLRSFRIVNSEEQGHAQLVFPYFKNLATYNNVVPVYILNSYYSEITNQQSPLFQKQIKEMKARSKQQFKNLGYSSYELKQYYDLALIDAFNEAINFQRPGGHEASNLDELTQDYKAIYLNKVTNKLSSSLSEIQKDQNCNIMLGSTIGTIVNGWACSLCGFINDCTEQDEERIDQSKLEQIRTGRLSLLLQKCLVEDESSFINIRPFWLYLKLEVAKYIANQLMDEFIYEMDDIFPIRTQ